jgi:succinyl-CoA synthetase beta subunit
MKIHEYQAKEILKKFGVAVPKGRVAFTAEEAVEVAKEIGGSAWVVKAQIHAGGRGKAGGIKLAKSIEEVYDYAKNMIGSKLVTYQTGPEGKIVRKVLVEEALNIQKELYVGVTLDRSTSRNVVMVSSEGGVEIEQVAMESPEKILKEYVDPKVGFMPYQARRLAFGLGLDGEAFKNAVKFLLALYKAYEETDASLAEINPLVLTTDGQVLALDAKMNFDDNALFRHPEIVEMRDIDEEDPLEVEASKYNLNYIRLNGECWVYGQWRWSCYGNYGFN